MSTNIREIIDWNQVGNPGLLVDGSEREPGSQGKAPAGP
jgi:hypothetical protein